MSKFAKSRGFVIMLPKWVEGKQRSTEWASTPTCYLVKQGTGGPVSINTLLKSYAIFPLISLTICIHAMRQTSHI